MREYPQILVFTSTSAQISTKSEMKTKKKKKGLYLKNARICMNSGAKSQKQTVFIAKSNKKQFLLPNFAVITSILGVSGLELHFSSTKPVTIFGVQSSLGGVQFSFGRAQAVIWGARLRECPPVAPGLILSS